MLNCHHYALELGRFLQAIRQLRHICTKAVISTYLQRIFHALKYPFAVVGDSRTFAVHWFGCVPDFAAKVLDNHLMAKTDSEYRQFVLEMVYRFKADSCGVRCAWAR